MLEKPTSDIVVDPLIPTVFHEEWWLDAATQGKVEFVEHEEGGRTVGRLPYVLESRLGLQSANMPPMTHFLGPGIVEPQGSKPNRFLKTQGIIRELLRKLPAIASFRQKMHAGISDALAFQAENYEVSVQFTFEIQPAEQQQLWRGMRDKTRNVIRRAEEHHLVSQDMDPEEFFGFASANLEARNESANVDFAACRAVTAASLERKRGHFLVARHGGVAKAAIFCAWDSQAYYYLMSTRAADSANGAIPLLLWHAIQKAVARGLTFDFDGVVNSGSMLLFSGFGGAASPRYIVSKSTPLYRTLREIRRFNPEVYNPFC
ncbi:GNAT family N-acetyltransferase [Labrys okinawensis]|uniref:GNAT family N-acetyltransferase n=1 Tax=Labrys okinawensis TaxID=346911 RepID=UPI001FE14761|nr:GNAT family N-acetyltransferase [Labrys okinawensis]